MNDINISDSVIMDSTIVNLSEEIKHLRKVMVMNTAVSLVSKQAVKMADVNTVIECINQLLGIEEDV
tara:strand:- start:247 stop:447 length:201 start_codon:yes stop_codon:yes gene_type:complete